MTGPVIETPRGTVMINTPSLKAELRWNDGFVDGGGSIGWGARFSNAQKFVDSEILRQSEKFTPMLTGMMIMSGTLGTTIGSGLVQWIAPYSRDQYYGGREPGESQTGKLRGRYWFERMKEVDGGGIVAGAKQIAGGG